MSEREPALGEDPDFDAKWEAAKEANWARICELAEHGRNCAHHDGKECDFMQHGTVTLPCVWGGTQEYDAWDCQMIVYGLPKELVELAEAARRNYAEGKWEDL